MSESASAGPSRAMLFPGQGAQHPGMAADIVGSVPEARRVFERAEKVLGFDLLKICIEGPQEQLDATDVCQPAILATSAAVVEAMRATRGVDRRQFAATAGLSLGEYTALWFAGSLSLDDALKLVRIRGQAMQRASNENPSGMLSLLGARRDQAEQLAAAASAAAGGAVMVAANFLAEDSVAISGANAALDAAEQKAKEFGIRKTRRLKVAGAFHSALMESATWELEQALAAVQIAPPQIPFLCNVTGDAVDDPTQIRALLARQVTSPVQWDATTRNLLKRGVATFVEPAPGTTLTGLLKRAAPDLALHNVNSLAALAAYA